MQTYYIYDTNFYSEIMYASNYQLPVIELMFTYNSVFCSIIKAPEKALSLGVF